ncbi:MAG: hypothetical protein GX267_06240 [Fibrobacter sp.]|jgi:hypothetical protein|nr:hypothetical protein [Fibrobacter sp.]
MKTKLIAISLFLAVNAYSDISIGVKGGLSLFRANNDRSSYLYNEIKTGPEIEAFCETEANKFLFHLCRKIYPPHRKKTPLLQGSHSSTKIPDLKS